MTYPNTGVFIRWILTFNEGFDAAACSSYGGTPCEEAMVMYRTDPAASIVIHQQI